MLWSPNLQLYHPFENQANDYSGNARHGTVFGSGVYATRPNAGRCLYFDGTGDYVATPSFGLSETVVVFAAWVRCAYHATMRQTIIGDNAYSTTVGYLWAFRYPATNNLTWRYVPSEATATNYFASPYNDVWLHLCIVSDYTGKYVYFYRDGIPFGSPVAMTGTPAFPSTARVRYLGSYDNGTTHLLTAGYLCGVQLWTLATKPPDAQMLANANRLMLGMNPIW